MHEEAYEIKGNTSKLLPTILDASVLSSFRHCEVLLQAHEKFFVSATLYAMLYEEYDRRKVFDTLRYFVWRPLEYLPYLEPYAFKKEYIEEIYPYYEKSLLPSGVKHIILDEYYFLKEHSSILMSTKRFARHLHRWGIVLVDATNKIYDRKHRLFKKIRGPRWLGGILLSAAGVARLSTMPVLGLILGAGGIILILFDP